MSIRFRFGFFCNTLLAATFVLTSASGLFGSDVRWKSPRLSQVEAQSIRQVTHSEPMKLVQAAVPGGPTMPQPLSPAQIDLVYPESRPQVQQPFTPSAPLPLQQPPAISAPRFDEPVSSPSKKEKSSSSSSSSSSSDSSSGIVSAPKPAPKPVQQPSAFPTPGTMPALPSSDARQVRPAEPIPDIYNPLGVSGGAGRNVQLEIPCPTSASVRSIKDISYDIRTMDGELPKECPLPTEVYQPRHFMLTCYQWKAAALCTKGAYFQDVQLERYGHSICPAIQPVLSGARFAADVLFLPYKMGLETPNECVYTLGYYRPGNCAPHMLDPLPISVRGAVFQAGAATGITYLMFP